MLKRAPPSNWHPPIDVEYLMSASLEYAPPPFKNPKLNERPGRSLE